MSLLAVVIGAGLVLGLGCDGGSPAPVTDQNVSVVSCPFSPPSACAHPDRGFAAIAPLIERACVSCHDGDGTDPDAPWPLTTYEDVADWADLVRNDISNCAMPPQDSGIGLSNDERLAIVDWILCGYSP